MTIPEYNLLSDIKKTKDSCLVIPVINEGEKFHSLVHEIKAKKIDKVCDFIISDGGSTDNTLDFDLESNILQLNSNEGLSSQLRAAYFFAKERKYKNIVTIDGNGKDDPSFIGEIIKKLNDGYDFVQCSRFIKEGKGINTPPLREFAIRYLHAPMLSFFSGFLWTDTTQGYRGYSSRFLFEKKISIFRNLFKKYELLAYLSFAGPKNGFKCIEIPVTRKYPEGKIPTKINSFAGNMLVFTTLIKACLGFYNPKSND